MEEKLTYSVYEVAKLCGSDPQTLRNQIRSDIEDGSNEGQWNARRCGNRLIFPKAAVDAWLRGTGVGPIFVIPEHYANRLIMAGLAVEAKEEA